MALSVNHLPPHAYILHGLNPRGILQFAGLVEVQYEIRSQDVACIVADHDGAPGCLAG